jgi:protein-tyrosine phosphatase
MLRERHLDWDACANVRDLGGLPTTDGRVTRWGAIVRADAPDRLSPAGWDALRAHGIRTIVDLRNDDERAPDVTPPDGVTTLHVPLDGMDDREFWDTWATGPAFGTPVYYRPFLDRFPDRTARAIRAIAQAPPGGVLLHCGIGRDRAGLVTLLVLSLAGVAPEDIADDYALSADRVPALLARLGVEDHTPSIEAYFASEGTSAREVILGLLADLDVEAYLRAAGLDDGDLAALRDRLVA